MVTTLRNSAATTALASALWLTAAAIGPTSAFAQVSGPGVSPGLYDSAADPPYFGLYDAYPGSSPGAALYIPPSTGYGPTQIGPPDPATCQGFDC
ncbi:MAG TPA: hypothetical protein VGJ20_39150 [Xanthobacteraceae bacterium]|jgi:hypothetical protein